MRPSALYYSVKLDLEREGRYNADGTVQPPYCDIYNSETGEHMYADESKRLMTKIDEYEPGDGRITDGFANAGASLSDSYLPGYDKANWTKYIYATASAAFLGNEHGYAAQSYITFDEFMRQHRESVERGGRAVFYTSAMKMVQQDALRDVAPWNPGDNWSESLFNEANSVPVYLPDMVQAASQTDLPELQLSVVARAVYPFLYDKDAHPDVVDDPSVTTSVPSASRRVYADAVRQLMLHNTILETPMEAVVYPSSVVSSIEEALADGNETPAEYYNFSGMRVGVNPPPGVYIRRRGTVVDNVVIRQ